MDQMNKGVPVAWAIVEHESAPWTKFLQVLKDEILRRLQTLTRSGSQAACSPTMLRLSMPQPGVLRMLFIALLLGAQVWNATRL
jgi:hypothetical protein